MPKIKWSPEARENLIDIFLTIAEDNPAAAERVVRELEQRVQLLEKNPRLGARRPEIRYSARILMRGVYVIIYEITPNGDDEAVEEIEVVSIVHGHRDMSALF